MNNAKLWFGLLIATLVIFLFLIPIDTYDYHEFFLSLVCGGLSGFFLFMGLGKFESLQEITEKSPPTGPPTRKYAPFAPLPAIAVVILLLVIHSNRKADELKRYGVVTKGTVVGGESTTTTRRFQKSTSYDIKVVYADSTGKKYKFEDAVNGSEFNNLYQGAVVDVVYSRRHPALAETLLSDDALAKYTKVPRGNVSITHLLSIFEGKIKQDSMMLFLNTINYEWKTTDNPNTYVNEKRNLAIRFDGDELMYLEKVNLGDARSSFEKDLLLHDFKKKAIQAEGQTQEVYSKGDYVVVREQKSETTDAQGGLGFSLTVIDIFHLLRAADWEE